MSVSTHSVRSGFFPFPPLSQLCIVVEIPAQYATTNYHGIMTQLLWLHSEVSSGEKKAYYGEGGAETARGSETNGLR